MRKRQHDQHKGRDDHQAPSHRPTGGHAPPQPRTRRFTPIKVGVVLGVMTLGVALYVGLTRTDDNASTSSNATGPPVPPGVPSSPAKPGITALLPAPAGTKSPINDVDPVTGKTITSSSPTLTYKGYVVAFCCGDSSGYTGGWERMAEADKDTFIRRCLSSAGKPGVTALPPAMPETQSPINDVDPVTGEPITANSPTIIYKGHVVAFCCQNSKGYNGGWERMSEAEKDAFIRRWLK